MINKNKSTFLNNCYEWLFTEQERSPIGFIAIFFLIIIISTIICLFLLSVGRIVMWI